MESEEKKLEEKITESRFQKAIVEEELDWDSKLRDKLNKNGFKKEEVSRFVDAALLMREQGYEIFNIANKFSEFEKLEEACAAVGLKKGELELRYNELVARVKDSEFWLSQNTQKLRDLESLKALGFGLPEFRKLRDIITEIGEERGLIGNEAVKDYFEDLEIYYYDYVRLRESVAKFKAEKVNQGDKNATDRFSEILESSRKPGRTNMEGNVSRKEAMLKDDNPTDTNHAAPTKIEATRPSEAIMAVSNPMKVTAKDFKPSAFSETSMESKLRGPGNGMFCACSPIQIDHINLGQLALNLHPDLMERIMQDEHKYDRDPWVTT